MLVEIKETIFTAWHFAASFEVLIVKFSPGSRVRWIRMLDSDRLASVSVEVCMVIITGPAKNRAPTCAGDALNWPLEMMQGPMGARVALAWIKPHVRACHLLIQMVSVTQEVFR